MRWCAARRHRRGADRRPRSGQKTPADALAAVLPEPDRAAKDVSSRSEQRLAEAAHDADDLRAVGRAGEERAATARAARASAWRGTPNEPRGAPGRQRSTASRASRERLALATERAATTAEKAQRGGRGLGRPHAAEEAAEAAAAEARAAANEARGRSRPPNEAPHSPAAAWSWSAGCPTALEQQLQTGHRRDPCCARLHHRGGRRFSDGLEVEPELRLAVGYWARSSAARARPRWLRRARAGRRRRRAGAARWWRRP